MKWKKYYTRQFQYLSKRPWATPLVQEKAQDLSKNNWHFECTYPCSSIAQDLSKNLAQVDLRQIWARFGQNELRMKWKKKYTRLLQYLSKRPWVAYKTPWGMANLGQGYLHKSCPNLAQVILRKLSCTRLDQVLYKSPWSMASLGQGYLHKSCPNLAQVHLRKISWTRLAQYLSCLPKKVWSKTLDKIVLPG